MGKTISEKILSRVCGKEVKAGDIIFPEPELVTIHDWYVVNFDAALQEMGVSRLFDPGRVLISTDHEPVSVTPQSSDRQKRVREIVGKYGIEQFYDVGRGGLGHIFPVEKGFVKPGMFVEAYDTHVTNFGVAGALAIPLVVEISEVLACGSVWLKVPETVRINLIGSLPRGATIRDAAQRLIAVLDDEVVDYSVVEFAGPALAGITLDERYALCNTPLEIGAKSAIFEPDAVMQDYLAARAVGPFDLVYSDPDARFRSVVEFDLGTVTPMVAAPPTPENVIDVSAVAGLPIQHAFIGSCASGTISDLRMAASLLRGNIVHDSVRLYITPATQEVARQAASEGLMEVFFACGATLTQAGCGPCAGGRIGATAPGERSINTGTRNDFGRLGAQDAEIYLASPLTVAASAVRGEITDPRELLADKRS